MSETTIDFENNNCFVCGPSNPIGLRIKFRIDGDVCRGEFKPGEHHVGYNNITHGGIIFSLLDDVMANWLFLKNEIGAKSTGQNGSTYISNPERRDPKN